MLQNFIAGLCFFSIAGLSYHYTQKIDFSQKAREEIRDFQAHKEDEQSRTINSIMSALKANKKI